MFPNRHPRRIGHRRGSMPLVWARFLPSSSGEGIASGNHPPAAVTALHRVLQRGGIVFASTHGFFPWHPSPQDHWRWTQTGLPLLFRRHGHFGEVEIFPTRGTVSGIFFLLAHYLHQYCSARRWRRPLRKALTTSANLLGEFLDRATPSLHSMDRPVTALPEFFVVARKG